MDAKAMRTLGMVARAIWPNGDVPTHIFDAIARPATMVALMQPHALQLPDGQRTELGELMARLPADLADPPGGVKIDDQGPFWLGYYHYASAIDNARQRGPAELARVGEALFGERWQTDLARALDIGDSRRIRQWMARERPIPAGVWADLASLVRERQMALAALLGKHDGR